MYKNSFILFGYDYYTTFIILLSIVIGDIAFLITLIYKNNISVL